MGIINVNCNANRHATSSLSLCWQNSIRMSQIRYRLAPTPSGFLHKGNAFNFLLNWLHARRAGAKVLLRIDDLDAARCRDAYLHDIFESLQWLGLSWDEGPRNVADFKKHWSQTQRMPLYEQQWKRLAQHGRLFACTCTRKSLREAGYGHVYPGICKDKHLPLHPYLPWRVRVPAGTRIAVIDESAGMQLINIQEALGDFVIKTREGNPAYQLASLCDDVHFGVTHIIRGQDLLVSTAAQLYLADLLQLVDFQCIKWRHHPLITDTSGQKLSKSAGSESLQYLRTNGYKRSAILHEFAHWLGSYSVGKLYKPEDLRFLL